MIPKLQVSNWAHNKEGTGAAFTVTHESEVLVSAEDLLKCIEYETCSNVLALLLNEIARVYSSDNGYFSLPFSASELTEDSKEFYKSLGQFIEDDEK